MNPMNSLGRAPLPKLPTEVQYKIISYVEDPDTLKSIMLTDRSFYNAATDRLMPNNLFKRIKINSQETIDNEYDFNRLISYLKSENCVTITLDLSNVKLAEGKLAQIMDPLIAKARVSELNIPYSSLNETELQLIPKLVNLKKLGLKVDKTIKEESNFNNFLNYLKSNSKLITTLDLSDCKLSYQEIVLIPKLTNLKKLGLKVKPKTITEEANFNNFLNYLKSNSKLITTLNLSEIDLSDGKLAQIINALSVSPSLTELNLSDCNLEDEDIELLPKLTNLKKLILEYNGIDSEGAKYISQLIQLEYLDLNYNNIEVEGAKHISRLINLRHLQVDENDVRADGAEHLSKLINLEFLSICENYLKDEGAIHIARLIKLNHLFINNNGIKGNATKRLVDHLTQLKTLDIGRNDLTDDDAKCIATKLIYLEALDISLNNIGKDGIKYIQERPRPFKILDTEQRPRR